MISVTKMHGSCNDFVVVDRRTADIEGLHEFARWACNRRTGIGADGLIAIESSATADVRMRIVNADGSEAEMCGNGIRCAARWLDEAGEGSRFRFETAAGIVSTEIVSREPEYLVRVTMGTPRFTAVTMPFPDETRIVDLGNTHVVIFRARIDDVELAMLATRLQAAKDFPNGTNVHVAVPEEGTLRVRHWERGVGLTPACGTGAVAAAAAAIDAKKLASPVDVVVPGGRLVVEWDGRGAASLTGPAARVFDTRVRVEAGAAI
ncbi:MAG: diaminopimelate epimerase [Candidatus Eremiobacteraeota bacterium]|nr:diaminopimelate epimerase [Candidatus Eremiobacteraeota bacterium]